MGILDDLAMGFGLKERTEDYDARTARTIERNQGAGAAEQYLGSRGYDEGYRPQVARDNRPFMQRLLFSQEGAASPTRYAVGPVRMDQPLPRFGILGLLSSLADFNRQNVPTVSADTSPMRVRPRSGYNLGGSAQPGTRFDTRTEAEPIDYSDGIPVQDPTTIAAVEALNSVPDAPTLPGAPSILADPTNAPRLSATDPIRVLVDDSNIPTYFPNDALLSPAFGPANTGYYNQQMNMGVGTDQLFTPPPIGMRLITSGPHAGKYIDANGNIRVM